ncbi:high nitrogen upregulated cytochrome P450 monooxygenase 2 [Artomyces pyxidatus]|uniref:High nitrogen upregulated cytochrome P450 monooxygenase 2 n=1 Tax=Artomyces pyxidatus TaxID=48021 RepID=A0ACB8TB68_9AGAM|nr:high nitrogen upregulated cytochrome P450 monooxygenase 2 [Artomyces pyxidatus]
MAPSMFGSLSSGFAHFSTADASRLVLVTSLISYLFFKRYEPKELLPLITLLILLPTLLAVPLTVVLGSGILGLLVAFTAYGTAILSFTLIYRLSPFHPLAQYPGPIPARISKWWSAYICAQGQQHLYYKALHERYGDVVRVGPNELSIRDSAAVQPVLGPGGLSKGPFWDHRSKPPALIMERDAAAHLRKRKPWNRAFTSAALKDYEVIINKRSQELIDRLEGMILKQSSNGKDRKASVDMSMWLNYFSTDFMGDIAFGGAFQLMKDGGDAQGLWHIFESGLKATTILAHVSWCLVFLNRLPGWTSNIDRMRKFARDNVGKRLKLGSKRKDLFYHLGGEDGPESDRLSVPALASEGTLAIIAGSETTGTTLTALFYYLLTNPAAHQRLREEIDGELPKGEELDVSHLSHMAWLNACINEALRLQPPVPSGTQRSVLRGMGPKIFGQHAIPEQTQLFINTYSMQRDPKNFSSPDAFVPERWLDRSGTKEVSPAIAVHNTEAFIPFSYGPANCVGKNLGLLEMRILVCMLLRKFNFQPADGRSVAPEQWEETIQDFFTMQKGPLWADITLRA